MKIDYIMTNGKIDGDKLYNAVVCTRNWGELCGIANDINDYIASHNPPFIINNNNQPPAAEPIDLCSVSIRLEPVEHTDGQLFVLSVSVERGNRKAETCQLVRLGQLSREELDHLNNKINDMAGGLFSFIESGGARGFWENE